jgi:DNA polymerase family A
VTIGLEPVDGILFYDTETTGLWPWPTRRRQELKVAYDRPFLFQFENKEGEQYYFRAEVNPKTREVDYSGVREELQWLREMWADPKVSFCAHNAQFDQLHTQATAEDQGFDRGWFPKPFRWRGKWHCTLRMAHVARPGDRLALKFLAKQNLGITDTDEKLLKKDTARARRIGKKNGWAIARKETHGKNHTDADYWMADPELCLEYGLKDVTRVNGLFHFYVALLNELKKQGSKLWSIYREETELFQVVVDMCQTGITYLPEESELLRRYYERMMRRHRGRIDDMGYDDLIPSNWHHLKKAFIDEKGYETTHNTPPSTRFPEGQPKIDAEQLLLWARGTTTVSKTLDTPDAEDGDKLARSILEWKACKKALEYLDSYDFFSCEREDGSLVIHPSWKACGPRTGRFSCSDPNAMQIADKDTARRHAHTRPRQREAFGPRPGHIWYMWDYSQYEVWIFIFGAQIKEIMDKMMRGWDGHSAIAELAWTGHPEFMKAVHDKAKYPPGHPKREYADGLYIYYRHITKIVIFTMFYGGGVSKIAETLQCSRAEAKKIIKRIQTQIPGIVEFQERMIEDSVKQGFVVNLLGREYQISRSHGYKSVNWFVQGSQADLLKRAMIRVWKELRDNWSNRYGSAKMFLTLHDELGFEVPIQMHSKKLMNAIAGCLQADSELLPGNVVPLPVKCKIIPSVWAKGKVVKFEKPLAA